MEHELIAYFQTVSEQLRGERLEQIDFDLLLTRLEACRERLVQMDCQFQELSLLRADYTDRISGMVKAIAAVTGTKEAMREALMLIESLETVSAEAMIALYRKIRARFRDHFPFSFKTPPLAVQERSDNTEKYT